MNVVDHTYGIVDIDRVSNDADHGYEEGDGWRLWFTESQLGSSIRFFYNGRVFWNDGDGFHVYKSQPIDESAGRFNYGQAKVGFELPCHRRKHAVPGGSLQRGIPRGPDRTVETNQPADPGCVLSRGLIRPEAGADLEHAGRAALWKVEYP